MALRTQTAKHLLVFESVPAYHSSAFPCFQLFLDIVCVTRSICTNSVTEMIPLLFFFSSVSEQRQPHGATTCVVYFGQLLYVVMPHSLVEVLQLLCLDACMASRTHLLTCAAEQASQAGPHAGRVGQTHVSTPGWALPPCTHVLTGRQSKANW
jgi:hypothetical protein